MRSEWREVTLGDIVEVKQGLAINAKSKHLIVEEGMPLLRITDLLNNNQVQFINAEEAPKQCLANFNDLIYTRTGQVGYVFRGKVGVVHNNCFRVIPKDETTTRGFLYWFLSQNRIRQYANDIASGSVQKDLNHSAFYSIPISLPSPNTQIKIEKILNSIDDKIELNRKMNQTLEAMAQALFKSWFVDFDPVHAKLTCKGEEELELAVKELGISKQILDLFPNEFEESELGMIPKGWETVKIETILTRYKAPKRYKKDAVDSYGKTIVLEQGADIILGYHNNDADFEATENMPMFIFGDHTCVMKLSTKPFSISENVIPLSGSIRNGYWTYYSTYGQQTFQEYRRHWSELIVRQVVLGGENICNLFAETIKPFVLKQEQNSLEIRELQKTRDTLLPKLLSGELDVSTINLLKEKTCH